MTDIFDDLVAPPAATEEPEATEKAPETAETNGSVWPQTVTLPVGEAPSGAVPVAEFAKVVNEALVKERVAELLAKDMSPFEAAMEAMTVQVSQASFYQAVKAQRNPLPHYTVRYEVPVTETGEIKIEEKTYVPVTVGLDWWRNRPSRGAGAAARDEESIERRLFLTGKKATNLAAAKKRLAKLTDTIKTMQEQLDKRLVLLAEDGKTIDDAMTAYEASVEAEEAEGEID